MAFLRVKASWNEKIGKDHDEDRVTGKDDGCQAGIGHVDADLEENHAEADIDQSQNGQYPQSDRSI